MRPVVCFLCFLISVSVWAQAKPVKKMPVRNNPLKELGKIQQKTEKGPVLPVMYEDLPLLIPKKKDSNFGYVNQKGNFIIQPEYHIAVFFYEDCNLLNSPNEKLRKFGTADYATVEKEEISYRIDQKGKRVYRFRKEDLGKCMHKEYVQQLFQAYIMNGFYGIIEKSVFKDANDYRQFKIYPQYEYLYILEGDDVADPMIIASRNDSFGVIDVNGNTVIPFEYADIKRNFSWKLGRMFEVSKDGKNYFYIDRRNKTY